MQELRYLKLLAYLALTQTTAGRRFISAKLGIGEGIVRRAIEAGREQGHLAVNKAGAKITRGGAAFLGEALALCDLRLLAYSQSFSSRLCGKICVAFGYKKAVDDVVKLRDMIVRHGGCGAIIALPRAGQIYIPLAERTLEELDPEMANIVKGNIKEETVIISCGDNFGQALAPIDVACMMREPGR